MSIHCYTDQLSYRAGDEVHFYLSSSHPNCSVEIQRWGAERISVWQRHGLRISAAGNARKRIEYGLRLESILCTQSPQRLAIGLLQRHRANEAGEQSDHFFVVRASQPGKANKILQLATNTYQAYNAGRLMPLWRQQR